MNWIDKLFSKESMEKLHRAVEEVNRQKTNVFIRYPTVTYKQTTVFTCYYGYN